MKLKQTLLVAALLASTGVSNAALIDENFALDKPTFASSGDASLAVDGNLGTRWESDHVDNQWFYVDLGVKVDLDHVKIYWEGAFTKHYILYVADKLTDEMLANLSDEDFSNDFSAGWTQVADVTNESFDAIKDGNDIQDISNYSGRYVAINCLERGTTWGNSFFEFEVYVSQLSQGFITLQCDDDLGTSSTSFDLTMTGCAADGTDLDLTDVQLKIVDEFGETPEYSFADNKLNINGVGTFTVSVSKDNLTSNTIELTIVSNNPNISTTSLEGNENVTVTSCEITDPENPAENAIDGNEGSMWIVPDQPDANLVYDAWIQVDLGKVYDIDCVNLLWEASCPADYKVIVSETGNDDSVVFGERTGYESTVGVDVIDWFYGKTAKGRFVKVYSTKAALGYGIKLKELCIYGKEATSSSVSSVTESDVCVKLVGNKVVASTVLGNLTVYNMNGVAVATANGVSEINVSSLPSGVYVVKAVDMNGNVATVKVVK